MSSRWIDDRINDIYTDVKNEVMTAYKTKYPDLTFTQDDSENVTAKFPAVYIFFDAVERMSTLDGGVINAVYMTIRTKVSVTKSQGNNVARAINSAVRDALSKRYFITSGSPIPTTSGDVKVINSNYQRVVGFNDPI